MVSKNLKTLVAQIRPLMRPERPNAPIPQVRPVGEAAPAALPSRHLSLKADAEALGLSVAEYARILLTSPVAVEEFLATTRTCGIHSEMARLLLHANLDAGESSILVRRATLGEATF